MMDRTQKISNELSWTTKIERGGEGEGSVIKILLIIDYLLI